MARVEPMMTYPEEGHARDLHRALCEQLADAVTVEGVGVHWQCLGARGDRRARVHCFEFGGPQYLTGFGTDEPKTVLSWGRTRSQAETVAAVVAWLEGVDRDALRDRFAFVDAAQRALVAIRDESIALQPRLGDEAVAELRHLGSDQHDLGFRAGDRSCRIFFYGENTDPDTTLHWDDHPMAHVRTGDTIPLAALLAGWLCDRVMPSALPAIFPGVEVDPVAAWYEAGRPVEGEFLQSWEQIAEFFGEPRFQNLHYVQPDAALGLINALRRAGWDRTLRAGQSLVTLILSRSRRHGLRNDQPWLSFEFPRDGGMTVRGEIDDPIEATFSRVALTPELESLLGRLAACPID